MKGGNKGLRRKLKGTIAKEENNGSREKKMQILLRGKMKCTRGEIKCEGKSRITGINKRHKS